MFLESVFTFETATVGLTKILQSTELIVDKICWKLYLNTSNRTEVTKLQMIIQILRLCKLDIPYWYVLANNPESTRDLIFKMKRKVKQTNKETKKQKTKQTSKKKFDGVMLVICLDSKISLVPRELFQLQPSYMMCNYLSLKN